MGIVEKTKRSQAIKNIEKYASNEALSIIAEMIAKPGASKTLVDNKNVLLSFL
ncbi:hypothetical protein PL373_05770 [Tenacibaculum maritimum]|nr:hypothetical protein [Tenacibaculum maritimum]MDB0600659.1 hypothetical protein [Tenacibaculum maritimum]MDB0612642.1 hypothetical protein [Tenacibaculum maritimum]